MTGGVAVLDMMDRRPIWAMPSWVPEEIARALPEGWRLTVIDEATDGSGDGAARVSPLVLDAVAGARVYFGYGIAPEILEAGPGLEWVHSGAAGVGGSLTAAMRASPVVFTNSAGVHAPPMAETVLAMILYFFRGLDFAVEGQREARWDTSPYYVAGAPLRELSDSTVGVIGYGGVGRALAARAAALGARVLALRRRAATGAHEGVDVLHGTEGLERVLDESDAIVLTAPETARTRGMIDAAALARMKPAVILINVARGKLIDEDALVAAMHEDRLRGVGLDVFWKEPLRDDHPLWTEPRALLTPHVSAVSRGFWRRETDLILRNLGRYARGEPVDRWENVVDKQAGY